MREIAEILLKIKAVTLSPDAPFTWASGIKSPIYCDNRLILSYPEEREKVENALCDLIRRDFSDAGCLMGTATAGIPHAAICGWQLGLPMGFVRAKAKDHGKENAVEGVVPTVIKTVVVEDLVSTGGSSLQVVDTLRSVGADVQGMVAIFTYGMKRAEEAMTVADVKLFTLTDLTELLSVALESGYIDAKQQRKLLAFRENPSDPSWQKMD